MFVGGLATIPKWVVDGIVLPTLYTLQYSLNLCSIHTLYSSEISYNISSGYFTNDFPAGGFRASVDSTDPAPDDDFIRIGLELLVLFDAFDPT